MHTSAEGASSANCCIESTRSVMHATKLGPKLGFYPDNHPLAGGAVLVVVGGSSREKGDRKILPAKFFRHRCEISPASEYHPASTNNRNTSCMVILLENTFMKIQNCVEPQKYAQTWYAF